jgi:predicted MFS family arabinose efflux permease
VIFPWVWSVLPGPAWVKALILIVVLIGIVFVLFEYVYPWISVEFGIQDQNIEQGQAP